MSHLRRCGHLFHVHHAIGWRAPVADVPREARSCGPEKVARGYRTPFTPFTEHHSSLFPLCRRQADTWILWCPRCAQPQPQGARPRAWCLVTSGENAFACVAALSRAIDASRHGRTGRCDASLRGDVESVRGLTRTLKVNTTPVTPRRAPSNIDKSSVP